MSTQAKYQLAFTTANSDPSQLYTGQANVLTLSVTNQSGQAQALAGGSPATPPVTGGPFAVALDLSALFTEADGAAGLVLTGNSLGVVWSAQYFAGQFPVWVISPASTATWLAGQTLTFEVQLTPTAAAGTYYATVTLENLGGVREQPAQQCPLAVATPPAAALPPLPLGVQLANTTLQTNSAVYVSRSADSLTPNELTLSLYNQSGRPLDMPAGGTPLPRFIVSFVTADAPPGYYALTTPDAVAAFEVAALTPGWNVAQQQAPGAAPQWVLTPSPDALYLLGVGNAGIASFSLSNIITQFAAAQTLVYVQCLDVPGYADTLLTVLLNKVPGPVQLVSFAATPSQAIVVPYDQPASTSVSWQTQNASLVVLEGVGPVPASYTDRPVPVITNQPLVLTAYDVLTGTLGAARQLLTVTQPLSTRLFPPGSIHLWPAQQTLPPGWAVCDGSNGTPDLRNFFVLGAGTTAVDESESQPTHTHSLTGFSPPGLMPTTYAPGQAHDWPTGWSWIEMNDTQMTKGWANFIITTNFVKGEKSHNESHTFPAEASHAHGVAVTFSGQQTAASPPALRPAWYALLYVMLLPG